MPLFQIKTFTAFCFDYFSIIICIELDECVCQWLRERALSLQCLYIETVFHWSKVIKSHIGDLDVVVCVQKSIILIVSSDKITVSKIYLIDKCKEIFFKMNYISYCFINTIL